MSDARKDRDDAVWDADLETFVHPVAAMFPKLLPGSEAWKDLEGSILAMRQLEPIVYDGDVLLDGRNRLAVCKKFHFQPKVATWAELQIQPRDGMEPMHAQVAWILARNISRRHLTDDQRAMIAAQADAWEGDACEAIEKGQFKTGNAGGPGRGKTVTLKAESPFKRDRKQSNANSTAGKIAAKAKVSRYKAEQALRIKKAGGKERVDEVVAGKKTIAQASRELIANGEAKSPRRKKVSLGPTLEDRVRGWFRRFSDEFQADETEAIQILKGLL